MKSRGGEYKNFMYLYDAFKLFVEKGIRTVDDSNQVDAVTAPTVLYEPEFTFEFGEDDEQPAITITQYSAKQYSKWMSAITECQFPSAYGSRMGVRLPSRNHNRISLR